MIFRQGFLTCILFFATGNCFQSTIRQLTPDSNAHCRASQSTVRQMTFDSNEQCRASEKLLDASTTRLDCQSADLFSVNKYADRCSRRGLFKGGALSALAASLHVSPAQADDITSTSQEVLLRLRSIPTFCLVNPDGVPFMIFDGQASATGYFFLSFDVAAQALKDAREKDKNAGATEIWSNAKIIVVPLAVALQLALRKTQREAVNNGIKFNTFNDIVASVEGVEAAKEIERGNKDKWSQKGRVPLFHIEGLKLDDGREPRYFNRLDLLFEWRRQHPNDVAPPIQVSELVELYRNALGKNDLSRVTNLVIVPVKETNRVASQLMKSSTDAPLPTYNFKKAYLVGSAKG